MVQIRSLITTGLVCVCVLALAAGASAANSAQIAPRQASAGICDGVICGPSGAFTVESFPTLTTIDWDAFPANPASRAYQPREGSRTLTVTPDGSASGEGSGPFALEYAVALARPGDVIWVADGEYTLAADDHGALWLDTPGITLAAETMGGAILRPAPGDDAPGVGIAARADDLTVDGFVLSGFRSVGIETGRGDSPQRNLVLRHLRIEDTEEGIRTVYEGDGSLPVIDGWLVYDVWLRDITLIGLQCGQGPCLNMRFEALRITMPPGDTGDSGADALAVESGANVVVFNAEVTGASGDGIDLKSTGNAVANVWVHDIGRNGIKLWHDGDVINALVTHTGADAALVTKDGTYRILNTLVARHAWGDSAYAATFGYDDPDQPGRVEIINSVFYQNAGAVWVSPGLALDVQHTLFYGSGNGEYLVHEPLIIGEIDAPVSALEAAGLGAANPDPADPGFADPDAGNYAFDPDSPLFDGGTADAVALPEFDLYGRPRVIGLAPDLGPVEIRPAP